ncbi:hypothetical protein V2O64_16735 [Verrucomicrobiaceae bacterium 227]
MKAFLLCLALLLQLKGGGHDRLLELADKWEVPQPKVDSKLIKIWAYYNNTGEFYHLGFVEPGDPTQALTGLTKISIDQRTSNPPLPVPDIDELSLKNVVASDLFGNSNNGLITAIQLMRMGHSKIGTELLAHSLKSDAGHHRSPLYIKEGQSAEQTLAASCLAAAVDSITTPKPDFPQIKRRIKFILEDYPKLNNPAIEHVLKGLDASIQHPKPEPGTIEALIDDYLMSGATDGAMSFNNRKNSAKDALILKGFAAIPTLITHLEDTRMTNHLMQGFNNFSSYPMTADLVINSFLQSLANDEFGSNWLRRQQGYASKKEAVEAWWKSASAIGEKEYVARNTLRKKEKNTVNISDELLAIAIDRYPELLPGIYQDILRSKTHSWPLATALAAHTEIPFQTRKTAILKGIATDKEAHRNAALQGLWELDRPEAEAILLRLIEKGPKTTDDEYWTDQNAALTRFVSRSHSPKIWKSSHDYLHRSLLGMRMELISNLKPSEDAPREILFSFFQIFDRYAYDKTVRDESSSPKFDGPGAGFPYAKIELRNFIHQHYAYWLKLDVRAPDREEQSPQKWATFRLTVARAVQAYRRKHDLLK